MPPAINQTQAEKAMEKLKAEGKRQKLINKWYCYKLECLGDLIEAYSETLEGKCCYVELYAGCGRCTCRDTLCQIDDAEPRVLRARTRFEKYIFIVPDPDDALSLKELLAPYRAENSIEIISGNSINERVLEEVFDLIPRSASSFALIDPPGYRKLRWSLLRKLAKHSNDWQGHKMDLLIIFPLEMALVRNLTRPECEASITRLYGNRKWQQTKKELLEGKIRLSKARQQLVELFKDGLKGLGYRHVADFKPGGFGGSPVYRVILATDNDRRVRLLRGAWGKERYLPCELLYGTKEPA